jgi:hypothetical protein
MTANSASSVDQSESAKQQTSSNDPNSPAEPAQNAAVLACIRAWNKKWTELEPGKLSSYELERASANAYRQAMPPLSGRQNIRDFIACVTKGLLVGAVDYAEGPKLLYAAQIAHGACEPLYPPRLPGRPRKQEVLPVESTPSE